MAVSRLDPAALDELRERMTGSVLLPDDPGYDDARHVFNGLVDKRPALVVQCTGAGDVAAAVEQAWSLLVARKVIPS